MGTHVDKLPAQKLHEAKTNYRKRIKDLYDKAGYPRISAILMVSCVSQEGIKELQDRIHHSAVSAVDPDTKENVIGQLVSHKGITVFICVVFCLRVIVSQI